MEPTAPCTCTAEPDVARALSQGGGSYYYLPNVSDKSVAAAARGFLSGGAGAGGPQRGSQRLQAPAGGGRTAR